MSATIATGMYHFGVGFTCFSPCVRPRRGL
jgi:hypothetical protein